MRSKVPNHPESSFLAYYVARLQQPVRNQVRHQHPTSVAAAMALAVDYDSCLEKPVVHPGIQRRNGMTKDWRTSAPQRQPQSTGKPIYAKGPEYSKLPIIRPTAVEKADRIRRGVCWYCEEKWVPDHACKRSFLAYIGPEEDKETKVHVQPPVQPETEVITTDLSHIYALEGKQIPAAIELNGFIDTSSVRILVDTGSSHYFLHPKVAERLSLPLKSIRPFRVYVGNGESLLCSHTSVQTRLVVQNQVFLLDLHILPILGPEVILGMTWLKSLRRVTNDYEVGTIEFIREGVPVCLKVTPPTPKQLSLRSFASLLTMQGTTDLFELIPIQQDGPMAGETVELKFSTGLPPSISRILDAHNSVFSMPSGMPPPHPFDHRIHLLLRTKPVNVRPYRYPYFQKNEIEKQVKEMLASGIIRPSQSPFSSPVLLIRKKDGTFRFCIDYRALNTATVPDHLPIPTTEELFDELGSAWVFTKLDLRSGYQQLRMHTDDIYKTAFHTHDGHFEFLVMPFGLTNAPSTFQSPMNAIFRQLLRLSVIVFFDDILIYIPSLDSHAQHLHEVFTILETNKFFVKMSKCVFCSESVDYLGHLILGRHLKSDPEKIAAMVAWPVPSTIKQLRGPLTDLLKKDAFQWSPVAADSFEALKTAITSAPVLRLPDFSKPFYLETNASDFGIRAVLLQDDQPFTFFSKKLGPRRRVTSTYHKELYAIVEAVQKWRQYLLGREFVIRSDQKNLKELLQQVIQTPDQHFYARKLMGYKFRIEYKTGASNRVADALSRRDMDPSPEAVDQATAATALLTAVSHPVPEILDTLIEESKSTPN
ncbi:uncharacterized protein LOC121757502 [Salvia splendens]|uniref:uncharacterized protein LOC121757502 n=1 Tax=Salvia splendens TaxID=180675 RepID=UPI001C25C121|nr:uncharacterized protein LOC121757502 [Salvia splendens]